MDSELRGRSYHPELIPRRGEVIAWIGTLFVFTTWLILHFTGQKYSVLIPVLTIVLLVSAASISLGNWVDRHTKLEIRSQGLSFHNGLRNVSLSWGAIDEIQVWPARWGKKVEVIGQDGHFVFHTLGEVEANGKLLGWTGFAQGDDILKQIIANAKLVAGPRSGVGEQNGVSYYLRK